MSEETNEDRRRWGARLRSQFSQRRIRVVFASASFLLIPLLAAFAGMELAEAMTAALLGLLGMGEEWAAVMGRGVGDLSFAVISISAFIQLLPGCTMVMEGRRIL